MIHVVFTVDSHPGKRDAWLAELSKVIPDIKAEAGCVEYVPTYDAERTSVTSFVSVPIE